MRNGGGPACLRLRIPLTPTELPHIHPHILLTPNLESALTAIAHKHYRDHLTLNDLRDPHLLTESRNALNALSTLFHLPALYDFQR